MPPMVIPMFFSFFPLLAYCLTFYLSKFQGPKSAGLSVALVWSTSSIHGFDCKRNQWTDGLKTKQIDGKTDRWIDRLTDQLMQVIKKTTSDFLWLETCLASVAQTIEKCEQFGKKKFWKTNNFFNQNHEYMKYFKLVLRASYLT